MANAIRLSELSLYSSKRLIAKYGDIEIDPAEFGLSKSGTYLHYIGSETDGSKIHIPEGIKSMDSMFIRSNITTPPIIPDSVTNMDYAFAQCKSLSEPPVIPDGVTSMCGTFKDCIRLPKAPAIPNGVTNMNYAFGNCYDLTDLSKVSPIPDSVISMRAAFKDCENLTKLPVIPDSVKDTRRIFDGCIGLSEVLEPENEYRNEYADEFMDNDYIKGDPKLINSDSGWGKIITRHGNPVYEYSYSDYDADDFNAIRTNYEQQWYTRSSDDYFGMSPEQCEQHYMDCIKTGVMLPQMVYDYNECKPPFHSIFRESLKESDNTFGTDFKNAKYFGVSVPINDEIKWMMISKSDLMEAADHISNHRSSTVFCYDVLFAMSTAFGAACENGNIPDKVSVKDIPQYEFYTGVLNTGVRNAASVRNAVCHLEEPFEFDASVFKPISIDIDRHNSISGIKSIDEKVIIDKSDDEPIANVKRGSESVTNTTRDTAGEFPDSNNEELSVPKMG